VATGTDVSMDLPHVSADGRTVIFRSTMQSVNPAALPFDPATRRVGLPTLLQQRTGVLTPTDVSPDGQWLLLVNTPDRHQDVFLMRSNGRDLSRLTDDDARDWEARFIGGGDSVSFRSNASGTYDAWSIRRDGSNRTQLTNIPEGVFGARFSPDGARLATSLFPTEAQSQAVVIGGPPWPMTRATSKAAPGVTVGATTFSAYNWSRDGRWLSGAMSEQSGAAAGHTLYEIAAGTLRQLNTDAGSGELAYLPGYRQVVYFTNRGALIMQDIASLRVGSPVCGGRNDGVEFIIISSVRHFRVVRVVTRAPKAHGWSWRVRHTHALSAQVRCSGRLPCHDAIGHCGPRSGARADCWCDRHDHRPHYRSTQGNADGQRHGARVGAGGGHAV